MAKHEVLMTGATGFIGSRLVRDLLQSNPNMSVIGLVLKKDITKARDLKRALPFESAKRLSWVIGDITQPNLGLKPEVKAPLEKSLHEIFHLAAVYQLDLTEDHAWRVNYLGTREVIQFAKNCLQLESFHHFSSLVAGAMKSTQWDPEQKYENRPFLNEYERSKYLSDVLIREELNQVIPTVNIFRPGVVVGDSQSGQTDKFDGFYYGLLFLWKFKSFLSYFPFTVTNTKVNFPIVPVDFVVKTTNYISQFGNPGTHIYAITEDQKIHWQEIYHYCFQKIVGKEPKYKIHPKSVQKLLGLPWAQKLLGFPTNSFSYVNYEIPFSMVQTRKVLEGSGIQFPHFWNYADQLLEYFQANVERMA